jgi:hypothetical protein
MPPQTLEETTEQLRQLMEAPEMTAEEAQRLIKELPPPPEDVAAYMQQVLDPELKRKLTEWTAKLPTYGLPAGTDPEMEMLEEELRREETKEPETGIIVYTYGLAPQLEELKSKYNDFWMKLKAWKQENLNKAKAFKDDGKRKLDQWKAATLAELDQKIPKKTAPRRLQVMAEMYNVYYVEYGKLAVQYEEVRSTVYTGYADTYYKSRAEYYKSYYLVKAALALAGT